MSQKSPSPNNSNQKKSSRNEGRKPSFEDFYNDYYDFDFENWIPEAERLFWKQVQEAIATELEGQTADMQALIIEELRTIIEQWRTVLKYVTAAPSNILWSLDDIIQYFKLPEQSVLRLIRDPHFPRGIPIIIKSEQGEEKHYRWFVKDVVAYTNSLRFPPSPNLIRNPVRYSIDCGDTMGKSLNEWYQKKYKE